MQTRQNFVLPYEAESIVRREAERRQRQATQEWLRRREETALAEQSQRERFPEGPRAN